MAWTQTTPNSIQVRAELGKTLGDTTTVYTDQIDFLKPGNKLETKKAVLIVRPNGTIVGADVKIHLYGRWESGGANVLLVEDAIVLPDLTAPDRYTFDVNAAKMPYYLVGIETDATETGNVDVIWTYQD